MLSRNIATLRGIRLDIEQFGLSTAGDHQLELTLKYDTLDCVDWIILNECVDWIILDECVLCGNVL